MKSILRIRSFVFVCFFLATATIAAAQDTAHTPKVSGMVWMDTFGGPDGVVWYPQYACGVKTGIGKVACYGFVEEAHGEPWFTNNLLVLTPSKLRFFSVQMEIGGRIREFTPDGASTPIPPAGFFQLGPRVNIHEAIPALKKSMHHLFVVALPHLEGDIRPNNLLIAGATNNFALVKGLNMSFEGYRRFFPGGRPDYGEYWFLFHPKKTPHVSFGAFVLHDGAQKSFYFGARIH